MITPTVSTMSRGAALLRTARPRQWLKNVLVVAAPLSAGMITEDSIALAVAMTFIAFCLAASSIYMFNDVQDADADRLHPQKQFRPVANGDLPPSTALTAAVVLAIAGLGLGFAIDVALGITVLTYLALQVGYARWLKAVAVVELAVVSSGFLLRAVAGGVAADVPLSPWFLIVASFGSLFVVAGKRFSELRSIGNTAGTRRALEEYSESYLRFVWGLAAAVTITAYSLWAFETSTTGDIDWRAFSVAPFVVGLLRYAADIDRGVAGEPEDALLRDRVLLAIGAAWVVVFAIGVYAG